MKNLSFLLSLFVFIIAQNLIAQGIGINSSGANPDASAMLDVVSTDKGILIPRMLESDRNSILAPAEGLMVYQTDQTPGFYYYNGSEWTRIGKGDFSNGGENGGADRSLGNKDNFALSLITNNSQRLQINNEGGFRFDGNIGIFGDPPAASDINKSINLYGHATYSNPHLFISGHNSAYINLESRRTGTTNGKSWRIGSGSGSVFDLDRFYLYNSDDGYVLTVRDGGYVGIGSTDPQNALEVARDQEVSRIISTTYRTSGFGAGVFSGRAARGTQASPSALLTGDYIVSFSGRGFGSTQFSNLPTGRVGFLAAEDWTDTERGTDFNLTTTPLGSSSHLERLRVTSEGNVGIGTSSPLTILQADGNITFAPAGQASNESRFIGQTIASQSSFDASMGFGGMEIENVDKDGTDDSAQQVHFWTHQQGVESARRMTIDTTGYVGIGTQEPNFKLEVVANQESSRIASTTYTNSGFGAGQFIGRAARGEFNAPSALLSDDYIASFNARGYGDTGFSSLPRGRISFQAAENWTDTEQGTFFVLTTTPIGTASHIERMRVSSEGYVGFGSTNPENALEVTRDQEVSRILSTTYRSAGFGGGTFAGRAARGSKDAPSALLTGDYIATFGGRGFGSTQFSNLPRGRVGFIAAEDWTDEFQGTDFNVTTTPIGTNSHIERMRITSEGNMGIGEQSPIAKLHIVQNSNSDQGILVAQSGDANAGTFEISNSGSSGHALNVYNSGNGYGLDLVIHSTGTGAGGRFTIDNSTNDQPAIYAEHNGIGNAGYFWTKNGASTNSTIYALHQGNSNAGYFNINNPANDKIALFAKTNGTGPAFGANHNGDGIAGFFNINSGTNNNTTLEVKTQGGGSAGLFEVNNTGNSDPVVLISGNGTGPSLSADGTIDMGGFQMNTSPTPGHVLTSDALGIGSWQAPAFDYSNGGEAEGTDRTLGNTDNYSLGFISNNINRMQIMNDGKIGIGTLSPNALLEIEGGSSGGYFGLSLKQNTAYLGYPSLFFNDHNDNNIASIFIHQTGTHLYFRLADGDFIFDRSSGGDPHMVIKDNGNVGIGTSSPSGILDIAGAYHFPSVDGTSGQVLKTDGSGALSWSTDNDVSGANQINDLSDGKTGGNSIFLGSSAGSNDDLSDNRNIGIGSIALASNLTGSNNLAIGYQTMLINNGGNYNIGIGNFANHFNQTGSYNTIIGFEAGKGGGAHSKSGNVFLGYQAGYYEGGSNKLYIENSNSSSPLIYGEFDTNLLRINGTLNINNAFQFPTVDGTADQLLKTDGSGTLSWFTIEEPDFSDGGEAGGADRSLGNTDDFDLSFLTNNVSRMTVNNDGGIRFEGNLGINTDPDPVAGINKSIKMTATTNYSHAIIDLSGHNSSYINLESTRSGSSPETSGKEWRIGSGSGSVADLDKFYIYNADDTYCMTIRDGGNIGIQESSPVSRLEVKSAGNTSATSALNIKDNGSASLLFVRDDGNVGIGTSSPSGILDIAGAYHFPSVDGTSGQVLKTDGSGALTWNNEVTYIIQEVDDLDDGKTGGHSLFLGTNAGLSDDGTDNYNVGFGEDALYANTIGTENTALGYQALYNNIGKDRSTAIGFKALYNTHSGAYSGLRYNTAVGYEAMKGGSATSTNNFEKNTAIGDQALYSLSFGRWNAAHGYRALYSNTTGDGNTAMGTEALYTNVGGAQNTAVGYLSLRNNTASNNCAVGYHALYENASGSNNTAVGSNSLDANTTGLFSTAVGSEALTANTSGTANVAIGHEAMLRNISGGSNTATGASSLRENLYGQYNTAFGYQALQKNEASNNTGVGNKALNLNVNGIENTAVGDNALQYNRDSKNIAVGYHSLSGNYFGTGNIGIGYRANNNNQDGNYNTIIGYEAGYGSGNHNKSYCVMIGYQAGFNDNGSNKLYISNSNTSTPLIYGEFDNELVKINGEIEVDGVVTVQEVSSTPNDPVADGETRIYIKDNKYIIQFNDGGTTKYRYMDLTSTDATWTYTTTAP